MPLYLVRKNHHVHNRTIMIIEADDQDAAMVAVEDGDKSKLIAEGDAELIREDIEAEAVLQIPMTDNEIKMFTKAKRLSS